MSDIETEPRRGPGRPRLHTSPVRSEDVRENVTEPMRQRKRRGNASFDRFAIDPGLIPHGISYEWKRETFGGQTDSDNMLNMRDQGWLPVPAERHPELVAEGTTGAIRRGGLMLMERPVELTREARQEEYAEAVGQVRAKERELYGTPAGTFDRVNGADQSTVRINRTIERGSVDIE